MYCSLVTSMWLGFGLCSFSYNVLHFCTVGIRVRVRDSSTYGYNQLLIRYQLIRMKKSIVLKNIT